MSRVAQGARDRIIALDRSGRRALSVSRLGRAIASPCATGLLTSLGYHNVLARGFTLVRDDAGRMLRRAVEVHGGQRLDIEFADGHVTARADGADRETAPNPRVRAVATKQGTVVSGLAYAANAIVLRAIREG